MWSFVISYNGKEARYSISKTVSVREAYRRVIYQAFKRGITEAKIVGFSM